MSLIKTWAPYFQSTARMRGRAYQLAGRVEQQPPQAGELVRAHVHGSQLYTVVIREDGAAASATCTCPHFTGGAYCKHLWATLLDIERRGAAARPADALAGADPLDAQPPPLKARKRQPGRKPVVRGEPEWIGRLSLLRPALLGLEGPQLPGLARQQVCYVVNLELGLRHHGLVVELYQRQPTAAGWNRPKRLRLRGDEDLPRLADPLDRELCALIMGGAGVDAGPYFGAYEPARQHAAFRLLPGAWRTMLARLIQTGRCFALDPDGRFAELTWAGDEPWALWLVGSDTGDGLSAMVELRRGDDRLAIDRPGLVLGGVDGVVIYDGQAAPFDDRGAFRWVTHFRDELRSADRPTPIRVEAADVPRFLDRLYQLPQLPDVELPPGVGRPEAHYEPAPHLEVFSPGAGVSPLEVALPRHQLGAKVWFAYGPYQVQAGAAGRFVPIPGRAEAGATDEGAGDGGTEAALIRRDPRREEQAIAALAALGFREDAAGGADRLLLPARLLPVAVAELLRQGWTVAADRKAVRRASTPVFSLKSGIDWFELRGGVRYQTEGGVGEETVGLPEILAAAKAGRTMIALSDGTQGLLPQQWLEEHGLLAAIGKVEGDHLRFKLSQAALLDALLARQDLVDVDEKFAAVRQQLHQFQGVQSVDAPATFQGTLRPYQREGLGWLGFLRWFGMGGILADDMGLGKTIQVLAMLEARYGGGDGEKSEERGAKSAEAEERSEGGREKGEGREEGNNGSAGDGSAFGGAALARADAPAAVGAAPGETASGSSAKQKAESRKQKSLPPTLIVVPRSVVFNWIDEAQRFTPRLRVQSYTGADREALRAAFADHDVIVTSYGLMRRDIVELRKHEFDYVVLDEAQAIKNPASQGAKAARLLSANHRLALTGTPVENHLGDLWSIFEFLNPGMLGSSTTFADLVRGTAANGYSGRGRNGSVEAANVSVGEAADDAEGAGGSGGSGGPGGSGGDPAVLRALRAPSSAESAAQLARALRPFILRRTKKQVLSELPEKTEQTIVCEMEEAQRAVYDQLLKHYRGALLRQVEAKGIGRSAFMVLEALLRLRQAACHPGLIDPQRAGDASAKLDVLLERVTDLIAEGHKALVFSQFTSMLALVKKRLDERGIVYEYLDGQTRHRKKHVERFQTDPACPLFLISLKAGGLGLNLTAAEYVFILDPWWNPAVEAQAIDRAHRIGQTRHVFAYRLICEDTVEQRIAELQEKKKQLADAIIGGQENLLTTLTREELERLLS